MKKTSISTVLEWATIHRNPNRKHQKATLVEYKNNKPGKPLEVRP